MLAHLPQGLKVIEQAYDAVEKVMKEVTEYVGEWLRYQVRINWVGYCYENWNIVKRGTSMLLI